MPLFNHFLGKWELIPESAESASGDPPIEGSYAIALLDLCTLKIDNSWKDSDGQSHTFSYHIKADGKMHHYENLPEVDYIKSTLIGAYKLETIAYKDGVEIGYAMREVLDNTGQMRIHQFGSFPQGETFTNHALYKKV